MMGPEVIRSFQDAAAARAARDEVVPLILFDEDSSLDDARGAPFLGLYVPEGWRPLEVDRDLWAYEALSDKARTGSAVYAGHRAEGEDIRLFADSMGLGDSDEPALTAGELWNNLASIIQAAEHVHAQVGVAVVEAGQFQIYLGLFVEDDCPAQNVPEGEFCPECDAYPFVDDACADCGYNLCPQCEQGLGDCECSHCEDCNENVDAKECECVDLTVVDNGTLWLFPIGNGVERNIQPLKDWWQSNVQRGVTAGPDCYVVEHRYAIDIVHGLRDAGFKIEVA